MNLELGLGKVLWEKPPLQASSHILRLSGRAVRDYETLGKLRAQEGKARGRSGRIALASPSRQRETTFKSELQAMLSVLDRAIGEAAGQERGVGLRLCLTPQSHSK